MTLPSLHRGLLPAARCAQWLQRVEAALQALPAGHADRQASSGSLRLRAVDEGRLLAELRDACRAALGLEAARWASLDDEAWVRCQHPAGARPPGQHPHSWHQDGALGSDFAPGARLRELLTLWLPLTPCGEDAPSLEWLAVAPQNLLPPPALGDAVLRERFGLAPRRQLRAQPGDVLSFDGALLHRTHVTPAMRQRRISLELRFEACRACGFH